MPTTTIQLKEDTLNQIKLISQKQHKKESDIIIEAINAYLKEQELDWKNDPFFMLGTEPKESGLGDLSKEHDKYLYDNGHSCKTSKFWNEKDK
jgi:hypothetical protein